MHSAHLAELILGLFTSRERAASIVGDLMENATPRGVVWFWSNVFRTALSLLWRDFTVEPSFMAGLAFRGLLLNLSLLVVGGLVWFLMCSVLSGLLLGLLYLAGAGHISSPVTSSVLSWVLRLAGIIPVLLVEFQTGRWIARRARGKEMASCVAFLIVYVFLAEMVGEALFGGMLAKYAERHAAAEPGAQISAALIIVTQLFSVAFVLAGAIRVRNRRMRRAMDIRSRS